MDSDNKTTIDYETGQAVTDQKTLKEQVSEKAKSDIRDHEKHMEAVDEIVEQGVKAADDRYLRICAEFENYKKRSAREMDKFKKFATESLIKKILPVVDNLERAVNSANDDEWANSDLTQGVALSIKDLEKVLGKHGVKPIEAIGKAFDPAFHEAVMMVEADDHPENTVINELQKGYLIHDRLLRPAKVVVSKTNKNP